MSEKSRDVDLSIERLVRRVIKSEFKMVDDEYTELPAQNRGKPWTEEENYRLNQACNRVVSVLALCFGRSRKSIRMKLQTLEGDE